MSLLKSFLSRLFDAAYEPYQIKQEHRRKFENMTDQEVFQLYKREKEHQTLSVLAYEALQSEVSDRIKKQQNNG